ncbi:MAG: hypothetical protein ABR599_08740 [Gemmatimonadota bacterium]
MMQTRAAVRKRARRCTAAGCLALFAAPPAGPRRTHLSSREGTPRRIEGTLLESRCVDSMSGEIRSFHARVDIDGRVLEGCAREGWPSP